MHLKRPLQASRPASEMGGRVFRGWCEGKQAVQDIHYQVPVMAKESNASFAQPLESKEPTTKSFGLHKTKGRGIQIIRVSNLTRIRAAETQGQRLRMYEQRKQEWRDLDHRSIWGGSSLESKAFHITFHLRAFVWRYRELKLEPLACQARTLSPSSENTGIYLTPNHAT